jgi:Protein of unknown function (DUF3311)
LRDYSCGFRMARYELPPSSPEMIVERAPGSRDNDYGNWDTITPASRILLSSCSTAHGTRGFGSGQSDQIIIRRKNTSQNLMNRDNSSRPGKRLGFAAYLLAGIPFFAVSFGVCFANRDEPILFGFPFLLSYLIFWICTTPLFLWLADRSARE